MELLGDLHVAMLDIIILIATISTTGEVMKLLSLWTKCLLC